MLSPEAYPTLYPFSPLVWPGSVSVLSRLPYRAMIISPPLAYRALSGKIRRQKCQRRHKPSSFTIDAILGLREGDADTKHYDGGGDDKAVHEPNFGWQLAISDGVKLPSPHCPLPADHIALYPGSTYLAPLAGGQNILRSDEFGEKDKDSDSDVLDPFEATDNDREINDRHEMCPGIRQAVVPPEINWDSEVAELAGKRKRVRTIFTQEQLDRLESEFARQQYMVGTERLYLAAQLELSESQVKVWFQNRRIKWRKQNLESQQEKLAQYRAMRGNGRQGRTQEGTRTPDDVNNEDPKTSRDAVIYMATEDSSSSRSVI